MCYVLGDVNGVQSLTYSPSRLNNCRAFCLKKYFFASEAYPKKENLVTLTKKTTSVCNCRCTGLLVCFCVVATVAAVIVVIVANIVVEHSLLY